jgi:excinuclease ABC subunit C
LEEGRAWSIKVARPAAHEAEDSVEKGLFKRQTFRDFGPAALALKEPAPVAVVRGRRPGRLRAGVRRHCPRLPGVYGMVDGAGELVYVGKAKCLRARLLSYFRPKSRDPKAGRILECTRRLLWEPGTSEFAALLRELELIRRWQPRFNVQGQPRRHRRVYVCLGRAPAPYAFLAAEPPKSAWACFGPVPGLRRAGEAVRRLNDWFGLRDCPQAQEMVFAEQRQLFSLPRTPGCLRHEIGTCRGPCAAACSQADYAAAVAAARAFLSGRDTSPLDTLEREMRAAAAQLAFERAAALRGRLDSLRWLSRHLERLRQAAGHSFVYPVAGTDGGEAWYLVRQGRVRAALPAPAGGAGESAAALLGAVYAGPVVGGAPALEEVDGVLLVAGWFRRHPEERARTLTPAEALARVR